MLTVAATKQSLAVAYGAAGENIAYERDDVYNEFLNEIYLSEILEIKQQLHK